MEDSMDSNFRMKPIVFDLDLSSDRSTLETSTNETAGNSRDGSRQHIDVSLDDMVQSERKHKGSTNDRGNKRGERREGEGEGGNNNNNNNNRWPPRQRRDRPRDVRDRNDITGGKRGWGSSRKGPGSDYSYGHDDRISDRRRSHNQHDNRMVGDYSNVDRTYDRGSSWSSRADRAGRWGKERDYNDNDAPSDERERGRGKERGRERGSNHGSGHDDRLRREDDAYDERKIKREEERKERDRERREVNSTSETVDFYEEEAMEGEEVGVRLPSRLKQRVSTARHRKGFTLEELRQNMRERNNQEKRAARDSCIDERREIKKETDGSDNEDLPVLDDRVSVLLRLGATPRDEEAIAHMKPEAQAIIKEARKYNPQGRVVTAVDDPNLSAEPRSEPILGALLRTEAVYMYGTDEWSTEDVRSYWSGNDLDPISIEWINDSSCNIVWIHPDDAKKSLQINSKPILLSDYQEVLGIESDDYLEHPSDVHWRMGKPFKGRDFILLRTSTE
eukprot:Ihof_evm4s133 gene=Ihof_evmTU4s133